MVNFCELYKLNTHNEETISLKHLSNPFCMDLFVTISLNCFKKSTAAESGLCNFQMVIVTMIKFHIPKQKLRIVHYKVTST